MEDILELLQRSKVDWRKTSESPYVFQHIFQGKTVYLRLNDFPDEPLCTVIIDGQETDLNELPNHWTLPRHRGES
jgi:hypothetical protein